MDFYFFGAEGVYLWGVVFAPLLGSQRLARLPIRYTRAPETFYDRLLKKRTCPRKCHPRHLAKPSSQAGLWYRKLS
jgi:hypothetical protein